MRTLLVDNLDSYTYNLFQLLAQVQGTEPVVVRHDAPEAGALDLNDFDNVVISPGPGHPGNDHDFGFSARVLAEATVPVLGVCLGHQGIGLLAGAEVVPAPQPRHGHLSRIRHDGLDLFAGIPQDFTAVRYHSLCVPEPLPADLEAIAWAEDGVLMGVRHRSRPLWGVQFHPESVLTEYGARLLENFRDLTLRHGGGRPRRFTGAALPPTTRPARPAPAPADGFRLHTRRLSAYVDAEAVFTARFARMPRAFWLDSSRAEPGLSRFSFLGDGSGPLSEFVRYDVSAGATHVDRAGEPSRLVAGSVFDYLKRELARRRVADPTLPFDFAGGYVGYFGYEMKADCGATNKHRARTPDACWLFADRLIVVDHEEKCTYLVCVAPDGPDAAAQAQRWLDQTAESLAALPAAGPDPIAPAAGPGVPAAPLIEPWLVRDREQYLADIADCQRELHAGESYEICLTNAALLPAPADPLAYYRALRRINPAPYAAFLQFEDVTVACSSPERFLRIDRDRQVETKPIKGTAPRDADPVRDAALRDSLAADAKTRAENLMIVDLLRNDLGRVCEIGSVHVSKLMAAETYATVHQLVSTVRGTLAEGVDAVDCVRAGFPGGSMTGAPKLRTLEIIDRLETEARGVYSGAIGFLGCNGTADLNIVIRTAVFADGRMHLGAGGAIVLDSDPVAEYDEMLLKMAAPMRAYWASVTANGLRGTNKSRAGVAAATERNTVTWPAAGNNRRADRTWPVRPQAGTSR
jgi:para-aminobenzoate synthetase